ncbi:GNAT family N-acetyltransferase [Caulobacter sp. KR2-114]|uniref:bifunctional acetate--CoA ligase family protein/GNAT family N-acetyltransferase n=1 Tax=Caulobacter sp. KR2-114 TaxID=3400912 RepID=UPI003C07718D
MTTRNLDALFQPKSIALIGASNRPASVGGVLARNLLESGFKGPVLAVNPHEASIRSTLCYPDVAALPVAPDLAVIATPPATVPGLVADLAARGCRAAVVITAGFGEAGGGGAELKAAMLNAARPTVMRIVGPNCLGVISPREGVNASFADGAPLPGNLALVAQSGAVTTAALDWATARGYGFSRIVTLGDMSDVDFGDMLDFLALDADTRAVVLYVESITQARKFMSAARSAARNKPVVVIKAGRSAAGARAALSHTGALAGADAVYDAAFRRAGLLRVFELRELFNAVTTLTAGGAPVRGERLVIVSNGGGAGVMAVDSLDARGGTLAELSDETKARLATVLPAAWSKGNPVDIIGDAGPERYTAALDAVFADPAADAVLALNCPTAVADSTACAQAVIEATRAHGLRRPVLTAWLGETTPAKGRALFAGARIPTYETPDEAVHAFAQMVEYARNQALLLQTPRGDSDPQPDRAAARALIAAARAEGRTRLTDPEGKALLAAYGVPVVETRTAATPQEAGKAAAAIGGPVALKILSRDISHKSDVGGVVLGVIGVDATEAAASAMLERIRQVAPQARLDGFMIQPMIQRPHAEELIAGLSVDPTFGPVVLFGAGGVAVEVMADRTLGLPPLDDRLARDMIGRTRVSKMLAGYRDRPAADTAAVADVLVRLSRLVADLEEVAELDINPLLADETGVLALDSRVRLTEPDAPPRAAMAIRPYPAGLEHDLPAGDGDVLHVRPIRPDDAPRLIDLVDRSAADDVRLRFRSGLARLPDVWAARLSQIDYDREMAFVAEDGGGDILGVARIAADPENEEAEFALMVRSDRQRLGLGHALLSDVVAYARTRGLRRVWGEIARDNHRMLDVAKDLGFRRTPCEDLAYVRAVIDLTAPAPALDQATAVSP